MTDIHLAEQAQLDAIERLRYVRVTDAMGPTPDPCSYADACDAIRWALHQPRRPETALGYTTRDGLEPGVYTDGPSVFRVKLTRSRYLTVYSLMIGAPDPETGRRELITRYMGGGYQALDNIVLNCMRLTLDQAESLSLQIGNCIACGKALRAAASVRASMGPVCRKRFRNIQINTISIGA